MDALTRTIESLAATGNSDAKEGLAFFQQDEYEDAFYAFDIAAESFRQSEDEDHAEEAEWVVNELGELF